MAANKATKEEMLFNSTCLDKAIEIARVSGRKDPDEIIDIAITVSHFLKQKEFIIYQGQ